MATPEIHITPDEKKKLEQLSKDIDGAEKAGDFHPLVKDVIALCTNDEGLPWAEKIAADDEKIIVDLIAQTTADKSTKKAVWDLLRFAVWLDQDQKAGMPAYQLINILNNAVIQYNLAPHRGKDGEFAVDETKDGRAAATGKAEKLQAPKLGEKPPEGSLKLDRIAPKRRI